MDQTMDRAPEHERAHAHATDAVQRRRALRRADRRRRHLGRRRGVSLAHAVPGADRSWCWRASSDFGGTWRTHHLPGHPLRQRPVHLRLPLQALDQRADRHRRRDPQVHGRGDRRERPGRAHPLPARDRVGRAGRAKNGAAGRSTPRAPTPARACASPPDSCGCARATTGTRKGYTPAVAGHGRVPGHDRAPAATGRPSCSTRASGWWSSVRARPRRRWCRRSPPTART